MFSAQSENDSRGSSPSTSSSDAQTWGSLSPPLSEDYDSEDDLPIKCPVFCQGQKCPARHHKLLQAILNAADTPDEELMERRLNMLEETINKYKV